MTITISIFGWYKFFYAVDNVSHLDLLSANIAQNVWISVSSSKRNRQLLDVYISKFLKVVAEITHKGIKRTYTRQKGVLPIVKGRLRMNEQARRMPHQQHINFVEFSEYVYDRPENRLIRLFDKCLCCHNVGMVRQLYKT